MMVEDQVDPGSRGWTVAVVVGLHVQQDCQPVVFPTVDALAQLHLQLPLLRVSQVVGVEVNLKIDKEFPYFFPICIL